MAWTSGQQQVIDERNKTILVSAAAGSGKTTVLVERIFQRITDRENPVDISRFLVVTFTRLAAAQMKEKLMKKLAKALEAEPENEHLLRQNLLVANADITTIDSFCLNLVRENFHALSIDPNISIGDAGMVELLKHEILDKIFQSKYDEAAALHRQQPEGELTDFELLVDVFCDGKTDDALKELVDRIYNQVSSYPNPSRWISEARSALDISCEDELNRLPWVRRLVEIAKSKARSALDMTEECLRLCDMPEGPAHYRDQIESDREKLEAILSADGYESLRQALAMPWCRLSGKKFSGDAEAKEACKNLRNGYKDEFEDFKFLGRSSGETLEEISVQRSYILPLLNLTEEFSEAFLEEKKKRKMLEFSDISHMAYELVCAGYDAEGVCVPTELGKKIGERYCEIYIDEYQDSNYLQEDILTALSGRCCGEENMFMVGDVKQSIYRFRMARPEIFVNKYNRFSYDGTEIKIELNHNFRSRDVVLKGINFFFYQLMGADLGGICYDETQALVTGKDYDTLVTEKDSPLPVSADVEVLLADTKDKGALSPEELSAYENIGTDEAEGHMIADRILSLVDEKRGISIYDEERACYRKATCGDIVILARSVKRYGETLYNVLRSRGIPVYLERSQGYFHAVEIQVILSLLSVVDNARQDIALASVMLSPIGGFSEDEITELCAGENRSLCLYERCECYLAEREETGELCQKLKRLFDIIEDLREKKGQLSISRLLWYALTETGYYTYALAMPEGEVRKANLDMLLEKAAQFENGYYKGLFHFLQYVEKLRLQEKDEGEAAVFGAEADVVRIMSMHKSKGLEFPIVFVSGMGKQFNKKDVQDNVLLHPDYYLASMAMYPRGRYKKSTVLRDSYGLLSGEENMAEHLRVLYVAMTRAKEKLILTGASPRMQEMLETSQQAVCAKGRLLPYGMRLKAATYLHHLLPCLARQKLLLEQYGISCELAVCRKNFEDIVAGIHLQAMETGMDLQWIKNAAKETEPDAFYRLAEESFFAVYAHEPATKIPAKLSTSDIKKMKAYDGEGYDVATEFLPKEDGLVTAPALISEEGAGEPDGQSKSESQNKPLSGSERGTLVHKFMELVPFERLEEDSDYEELLTFVRERLAKLCERGVFDEREKKAIYPPKIAAMLASDLGRRMTRAAKEGRLYKEQQFSSCIPANSVYENQGLTEEDVLIVQGIIDGFFYEEGGIVVMDYKTDACDRETLVNRYKAQIENYAQVVEQLTGDVVKERVFYSFYLGETVQV